MFGIGNTLGNAYGGVIGHAIGNAIGNAYSNMYDYSKGKKITYNNTGYCESENDNCDEDEDYDDESDEEDYDDDDRPVWLTPATSLLWAISVAVSIIVAANAYIVFVK